jgi:putative spermidine/putrescine transport system permease protein
MADATVNDLGGAASRPPSGPVLAADGTPLKASLARAQRRQRLRAFGLVAPLLAFVLLTFIAPIGDMLFRSVENQIIPDNMPRTVAALKDWDPSTGQLPDDAAFAALVADMTGMVAAKDHTRVGSRLNYETGGMSGLFRKTGRNVDDITGDPRAGLIDIDKDWGKIETWATIRNFSGAYTLGYFLNALDLGYDAEGDIVRKPPLERVYIMLFERTLWLSLGITCATLLLGYPIAYLLANLPLRTSNLLLILVLLPFWTSLLVRTSAWIVLLQNQGVINDVLVWLGVIDNAGRLDMIFNETGTIIAMTHILLPFMILPLYSVMKTIPPSYVRAAKSLGATNWTAFWRVYFPNSVPGIGAGAILVFILSIGYYITPELVGGTTGVFISNRIAYHISSSLNWGLAAALAVLLLIVVMGLYWLYDRIVGIDNVKLG